MESFLEPIFLKYYYQRSELRIRDGQKVISFIELIKIFKEIKLTGLVFEEKNFNTKVNKILYKFELGKNSLNLKECIFVLSYLLLDQNEFNEALKKDQ